MRQLLALLLLAGSTTAQAQTYTVHKAAVTRVTPTDVSLNGDAFSPARGVDITTLAVGDSVLYQFRGVTLTWFSEVYSAPAMPLTVESNREAPEWSLAYIDDDKSIWASQRTLRINPQGERRVWIRKRYTAVRRPENLLPYNESKELTWFNCREDQMGVIQASDYLMGELVKTYDHESSFSWRSIVPGSVGEAVLRFVCAMTAG